MIALTTQPTNNGYYTAYLPVEFVATETANEPAFLDFQLRNADASAITGVPKYSAPRIGGEYKFNASAYLKSLFDVRTSQGLSTTAIEELTDLYGKFEVIITDPTGEEADLVSNEFYAFAFTDTVRFENDQTANNGISNKVILYSESKTPINTTPLNTRFISKYNRVNLFVTAPQVAIVTPLQNIIINVSSHENKLISIPLNINFITSIASISIIQYNDFKVLIPVSGANTMQFIPNNKCNLKEFIYVNRYGVKDTLVIESKDFERLATKSDEFEQYTTGLVAGNFNTGSTKSKVNQQHSPEFKIEGQKFNISKIEQVKDFIKSPLHLINKNGLLVPIVVFDQAYQLVEDDRGVELNFRYKNAQKELSHL